jgi:1,4-alpha-glucan branching enzyme
MPAGLLPAEFLEAFREGRHARPFEFLGAHLLRHEGVDGVRFAVWAPHARRASVVGDFNAWDGRSHPLRRREEAGVWEGFVPGLQAGALYKYELEDAEGRLLPLKADPFAFAAQLRPDTASIVAPLPPRRPLPPGRADANRRAAPLSIYEVHAASWGREDGGFPDWDFLAANLPAYAADLGFTHIELMPVSEHPFDGSWGYQALGMHAPSARFGDPAGLTRFAAACHDHGLGLLLDWVPAHFPNDAHGLANFDGTPLFEYADPREGFHRDWNTVIYDFGKPQVRSFLIGSALYWLERHGVDGLRVDAVASMLYRDYSRPSGEWIPNVHGGNHNLEAISLLQRLNEVVGAEVPGAITIAEESTAFPGVSAPTSTGGLGFHYKWNMGWMNDTLGYLREDPIHRRWHHDKMSFGLVYAFSENFVLPLSHDEVVHGKGSLLAKMPGDEWQRFANLRAYYGFMWGHPGKKLLFMGQEFAQPTEWNHDASLPWQLLQSPRHAGMQRLVRALNRVYREHPALHALDSEADGFEWLVADDAMQSIFCWLRRDRDGNEVIVLANFTPQARAEYRVGLPPGSAARWRVALDSDAGEFGGSGAFSGNQLGVDDIPAHGHARSLCVQLPPLATLFLVPA